VKSTKSHSWTSRFLGLAPSRLPPHVFQISPSRLRYVRIGSDAGLYEVQMARDVDLSPESFHSGVMGGPLRDREIFDQRLAALLADVDGELSRASLVLPDAWLRIVPVDIVEGPVDDEDVLRWRLRKLVPFNVDGLRVRAVGSAQGEGTMLLGFAVEQLLAELENAFGARGIRLGFITNRSSGVAAALSASSDLRSVTLLAEEGYSVVVVRGEETVLTRYKSLAPYDLDDHLEALVRRDFDNTRRFLEDELGVALSRNLVCGPEEAAADWLALVESSLPGEAAVLGAADLRPVDRRLDVPWHVLGPMLGVAATELT